MHKRYQVAITRGDDTVQVLASTYRDIVAIVNNTMGFEFISLSVVRNWMSRGKKSPRYGCIQVTSVPRVI